MPTYEYRCKACGHEFELFQSMRDKPKRTCPACKKARLERLIGTGAAVLFKGAGFYETDYRSESYKKAAEAESKPPSDSKESKQDATPSAAEAVSKSDAPVKAQGSKSDPEKPAQASKRVSVPHARAATKSTTRRRTKS